MKLAGDVRCSTEPLPEGYSYHCAKRGNVTIPFFYIDELKKSFPKLDFEPVRKFKDSNINKEICEDLASESGNISRVEMPNMIQEFVTLYGLVRLAKQDEELSKWLRKNFTTVSMMRFPKYMVDAFNTFHINPIIPNDEHQVDELLFNAAPKRARVIDDYMEHSRDLTRGLMSSNPEYQKLVATRANLSAELEALEANIEKERKRAKPFIAPYLLELLREGDSVVEQLLTREEICRYFWDAAVDKAERNMDKRQIDDYTRLSREFYADRPKKIMDFSTRSPSPTKTAEQLLLETSDEEDEEWSTRDTD